MPADPDQDILDFVDTGDRDGALRLLMNRYGKSIHRFVQFQLRKRPSVDDVHAKVFVQAHRDLPRFARRSSLRSWLFVIARNRVLDELKREKLPADELDPDLPAGDSLADQQLDDARLLQALYECILRLPQKSREVVLLKREGFSFEEIAEALGERAGTVQARATRAYPWLKECVEKRTGARV